MLWYDGTTWNAFLDRCPHRLAALSEGRVEDNKLQCAYHGYEFASSGACVRVPHAADAKSHANALASPRSCAQVYPAKVSSRLLWVWGDPQTPGLAASSAPAFESDTSDALMFARMLPCMCTFGHGCINLHACSMEQTHLCFTYTKIYHR